MLASQSRINCPSLLMKGDDAECSLQTQLRAVLYLSVTLPKVYETSQVAFCLIVIWTPAESESENPRIEIQQLLSPVAQDPLRLIWVTSVVRSKSKVERSCPKSTSRYNYGLQAYWCYLLEFMLLIQHSCPIIVQGQKLSRGRYEEVQIHVQIGNTDYVFPLRPTEPFKN